MNKAFVIRPIKLQLFDTAVIKIMMYSVHNDELQCDGAQYSVINDLILFNPRVILMQSNHLHMKKILSICKQNELFSVSALTLH